MVLLEILSIIVEEIVDVGGLVNERFSRIVMNIHSEGGRGAKSSFMAMPSLGSLICL